MFTQAALPRRAEIAIVVSLGLLTVAAWIVTARLMAGSIAPAMSGDQMSVASTIALDVGMWVAMMAAMMLPSTAPVLAAVAQIARTRQRQGATAPAPWVFGIGYLLVWLVVGVIGAGIDLGTRGLVGASPALTSLVPLAGGTILVLAGLYQLSPLKNRCLAHCRSSFGFLLLHWREGVGGAIELGARHGLYCLGCCWALMVTLLVTGALGLVWPLTLALLIFAEKVLPGGRYISRIAAIVLIVLGLAQATGVVMLGNLAGM